MKKSTIKRICIAAVLIIVFVIIVVLCLQDSEPEPSYQFLTSRDEAVRVYNYSDPLSKQRKYRYSFRKNFNDVCELADKELLALGYKVITLQSPALDTRQYQLSGKSSYDYISVGISSDRMNKKYSIVPNNRPSTMNVPYYYQADSIIVTVIQSRAQNKYIGKIKHFFNKIRGQG